MPFETINSALKVIRRPAMLTRSARCTEQDQVERRRALISRNLAELVRLNPDLVPIKGSREVLESKLTPDASRVNRFVDFNFDIRAVPRSSSSFIRTDSRFYSPPVLFPSLYPSRFYCSGDSATAPGRLYGRTPVIGWSRFIDGGISPFERVFSKDRTGARRVVPVAIPISGKFPRNRIFEFPFTRDRFVGTCHLRLSTAVTTPFSENFLNFPRNKILRFIIKYLYLWDFKADVPC